MSQSHFSSANFSNVQYLDQLYGQFLQDPDSIDSSWSNFFKGFEMARQLGADGSSQNDDSADVLRISRLIREYRRQGHIIANTNPLVECDDNRDHPTLEINRFGFTPEDLDRDFPTDGLLESPRAPLRQILKVLREIYCSTVAIEYMHLFDPASFTWFQNKIEPTLNRPNLTKDDKLSILDHLSRAELFEKFLHTKYVGQKRFSLEGAEVLIAALGDAIDFGSDLGINEFLIGMPHRGRLNVLTNILHKDYSEVFSEFEDDFGTQQETSGDVKYHKGFTSKLKRRNGEDVIVSLAANPSHLEAVNPVVLGKTHAKQTLKNDRKRNKILSILIHGDASIAGQGVVYECFQMARLPGYKVGGTLHIVVNNQIGFTAKPEEGRSSRYCTDIAKIIGAPIFHVNGEDPEGVIHAIRVGLEYLYEFKIDVVIDIVCYRKHGHNEGDEPSFTSPLDYKIIRKKPTPREIYLKSLLERGHLEASVAVEMEESFKLSLSSSLESTRNTPKLASESVFDGVWSKFSAAKKSDFFALHNTSIPDGLLKQLVENLTLVPEGFNLLPQLSKLIEKRATMIDGEGSFDWAMAEHLAFASLLWDGVHVRLAGQDSCRGTFSQRHAVWFDSETEKKYTPLKKLKEGQGRFDVYNSLLSEYAALGFEYGYSLSYPSSLVMWEAQFGDFVNGAQIIVDQFICSSEQKWRRYSGVVLLLPHGQEGQGPEHSSARLERFLNNCSQNNIQVAVPTTPAQYFHLLRRQVIRYWRRPLVICTPKGFLRNPRAVSKTSAFTQNGYHDVLKDDRKFSSVRRVLICSGKVFYDLDVEREKRDLQDIAIVRMESIYPFNKLLLQQILKDYDAKEIMRVQEEPINQGAFSFVRDRITEILEPGIKLKVASRPSAASPAVGSKKKYDNEFKELMESAFRP